MLETRPCPGCTGGRLEKQPVLPTGTIVEFRCNQCGLRTRPENPSHALPDSTLKPTLPSDSSSKSSKPTRREKTGPIPKRVSVPMLSPPPAPRNNLDRNDVYQIQCRTYAGYRHFRERAVFYRDKAKRCKSKNRRLSYDYCARLCENLAHTLGQIYLRQTPTLLRKQLREQHRLGHAVKVGTPPVTTLLKTYSDLMLQAMTHLKNDPVVQEWRRNRSALGDRKYLRRARKGFEKRVQAPYKTGQEALGDLTTIELGMEGHTDGEIRAVLKTQGLPARSREGIRKRLKSLRVRETLLIRRSSGSSK